MEAHLEMQFRRKVEEALLRAKVILDTNKHPVLAEDAQHHYSDKYLLAESMTNAAAASQLNCLASLGLDVQKLEQLRGWAVDQKQAVSLVFRAEERCAFLRESTRDVTSPTKHVDEVSVGGAVRAAFTSKTVTTITEYFWKFQASYSLSAIRGVGEQPEDKLEIRSRNCEHEMMTTTKETPRPEAQIPAAQLSVNISWILRLLHSAGARNPFFQINRKAKDCHTPRRNIDIEAALEHFQNFSRFAQDVDNYIDRLWSAHPGHGLDLGALTPTNILVPVLPLLVSRDASDAIADDPDIAVSSVSAAAGSQAQSAGSTGATATSSLSCLQESSDLTKSPLLRIADTNKFLEDESRCLQKKQEELSQVFPVADAKLVSAAEAVIRTTLRHCSEVCSQFATAVDYIEAMLRRQLIDAIGKAVMPADFAEYMRFHSRKLFGEAYQPAPFSFAVRRTHRHSPEGILSVEQLAIGGGDSNIFEPVLTVCARTNKAPKMHFALNASTTVRFGGDRHLHGWLQHRFSNESGSDVRLVARARQFSSMIVLIGRIQSATSFAPKHAAIVQNKDELVIPLSMSMIPSAKEFKEAISSLSAEQQGFAKAFRSMQLESTMFGVLVIQIKPQLERVLNLPEDSLTKEIKLTQDLMQLFIKYNIPADLLSYDAVLSGDGFELTAATAKERLSAVKEHVEAMQDMIKKSQEEEIEERKRQALHANPLRGSFQVEPRSLRSSSTNSDIDDDDSSASSLVLQKEEECRSRDRSQRGRKFQEVVEKQKVKKEKDKEKEEKCRRRSRKSPAAQAKTVLRINSVSLEMADQEACRPSSASSQPNQQPSSVKAEDTTGQSSGDDRREDSAGEGQSSVPSIGSGRDWTEVPREMDEQFETLDRDAALRPTIINTGETWQLKAQKALLASPTTTSLHSAEQKSKKDEAFDLLDGLTKAGAIDIEDASLHIVIASTHCFDKSVIETLVQDNVNPIERVERSTLIMAATMHQQQPAALIRESEKARLTAASPQLFLQDR